MGSPALPLILLLIRRFLLSPGLQHWAKLQKLKEGAKTLNYLAEHGIDSSMRH